MLKRSISALFGFALLANVAAADPILSYDTVDLGYKWTYFDDSEFDNASGLEARLSYSPIEHLFLEAGYDYFNTELGNFDVDNHTFRYGGGVYVPFGCEDEFHLVARVGGLHTDLNGDFDTAASDDGVYARPELRIKLAPELELAGGAEYQWYSEVGNGWDFIAQALYAVDENLALTIKADMTDDSDVGALAGVRYAY